jgi:hypothetical protein
MAEASGVIELEDEAVLQFIERSEAANTVGKDKERPEYLVSCISHSLMVQNLQCNIINLHNEMHMAVMTTAVTHAMMAAEIPTTMCKHTEDSHYDMKLCRYSIIQLMVE